MNERTVRIPFTAEQRALAFRWDGEVMEQLAPGGDYTPFESEDRFAVGYMGEIAVAEWLEAIKADYCWTVDVRGRRAPSEFVVRGLKGYGYLEVKASRRRFHDTMMIPPEQEIDAGVFVAVDMPSDTREWPYGELMGWLNRDEVAALPIRTFKEPTRAARYRDMRPMWTLEKGLADRRIPGQPLELRRRVLRRGMAA